MPAKTEKQRKFMGAELARKRASCAGGREETAPAIAPGSEPGAKAE